MGHIEEMRHVVYAEVLPRNYQGLDIFFNIFKVFLTTYKASVFFEIFLGNLRFSGPRPERAALTNCCGVRRDGIVDECNSDAPEKEPFLVN